MWLTHFLLDLTFSKGVPARRGIVLFQKILKLFPPEGTKYSVMRIIASKIWESGDGTAQGSKADLIVRIFMLIEMW